MNLYEEKWWVLCQHRVLENGPIPLNDSWPMVFDSEEEAIAWALKQDFERFAVTKTWCKR